MNPSDIVPPLPAAKDARRIGVKQNLPSFLINIMPWYKKHLCIFSMSLFYHGAQMCAGLCGEVFIRIDKDNPISRCMGKCRIARSRKVICPRDMIYSRAERLCYMHRIIRGARINDDQLINFITQALNGVFQMNSIVAHNIACRNAKHLLLLANCRHFHIRLLLLQPSTHLFRLFQMLINLRNSICHTGCSSVIKE